MTFINPLEAWLLFRTDRSEPVRERWERLVDAWLRWVDGPSEQREQAA